VYRSWGMIPRTTMPPMPRPIDNFAEQPAPSVLSWSQAPIRKLESGAAQYPWVRFFHRKSAVAGSLRESRTTSLRLKALPSAARGRADPNMVHRYPGAPHAQSSYVVPNPIETFSPRLLRNSFAARANVSQSVPTSATTPTPRGIAGVLRRQGWHQSNRDKEHTEARVVHHPQDTTVIIEPNGYLR
jgi:hypothetical protein